MVPVALIITDWGGATSDAIRLSTSADRSSRSNRTSVRASATTSRMTATRWPWATVRATGASKGWRRIASIEGGREAGSSSGLTLVTNAVPADWYRAASPLPNHQRENHQDHDQSRREHAEDSQ